MLARLATATWDTPRTIPARMKTLRLFDVKEEPARMHEEMLDLQRQLTGASLALTLRICIRALSAKAGLGAPKAYVYACMYECTRCTASFIDSPAFLYDCTSARQFAYLLFLFFLAYIDNLGWTSQYPRLFHVSQREPQPLKSLVVETGNATTAGGALYHLDRLVYP
jgi:hypothetical protein